jgi:hypothetical protein
MDAARRTTIRSVQVVTIDGETILTVVTTATVPAVPLVVHVHMDFGKALGGGSADLDATALPGGGSSISGAIDGRAIVPKVLPASPTFQDVKKLKFADGRPPPRFEVDCDVEIILNALMDAARADFATCFGVAPPAPPVVSSDPSGPVPPFPANALGSSACHGCETNCTVVAGACVASALAAASAISFCPPCALALFGGLAAACAAEDERCLLVDCGEGPSSGVATRTVGGPCCPVDCGNLCCPRATTCFDNNGFGGDGSCCDFGTERCGGTCCGTRDEVGNVLGACLDGRICCDFTVGGHACGAAGSQKCCDAFQPCINGECCRPDRVCGSSCCSGSEICVSGTCQAAPTCALQTAPCINGSSVICCPAGVDCTPTTCCAPGEVSCALPPGSPPVCKPLAQCTPG